MRSDDASRDEIGLLAAQINQMAGDLAARLAQVEQLAATRQEFYRRVSHELRTPLAAIRGTAENLEDDASAEQLASLTVIQTEAARLQRLVNELLEPGEHQLVPIRQRRPIDLVALARECVALLQPRAERAGIMLQLTAAAPATVVGDRDRVKQAVLNLLDNSLASGHRRAAASRSRWTSPLAA